MKHGPRLYQAATHPNGRVAAGTARLCPGAGKRTISCSGADRNGPSVPRAAAASISSGALRALILLSFLFLTFATRPAAWAVPPGTVISNSAAVSYVVSGTSLTTVSNLTTITTVTPRTPSTLELLQYGPGAPGASLVTVQPTSYSTSGTQAGPFVPLAPPVSTTGAPISIAVPVPLVPAPQYHAGEPVVLRVTDADQNLDPTAVETVMVSLRDNLTGDVEVLRLTETGPNTGVFTGYVQSSGQPASTGNGLLNVMSGSRIDAVYTDAADASDTRAQGVLVDPFGLVFDSTTGQPVNGASVTLVDGAGNPATVFGDDGISTFPPTVVTGGTATDSSGRTYTFPPGGYRFPFIVPGTYRFITIPPAGYRAPSTVPTPVLQTLPGGPFAIVAPGSRGEQFVVNPGPALHIDIPVDPAGSGLWLIKAALKETAAVGDFVPYRLEVQNTSASAAVPGVAVQDRLPSGFRFRKGSARLNGSAVADPVISADGRELAFPIGALAAGGKAAITYVAEVGAGARPGRAVNHAVARSAAGTSSNIASATVMIAEDLFRSTVTIVGRIIVDGCGDKERSDDRSLAGVRLFLENGTYVVTDQNGMYHFEAVSPGTHVVQVDRDSLPPQYELLRCENNTRFAGNEFSQFVDAQGGTLWRADFHAGLRPKQVGEVAIEITTSLKRPDDAVPGREIIEYAIPIHVGPVPARNLRLSITLPEKTSYLPGSSDLRGGPLDEAFSSATGTMPQTTPVNEPQQTEGAITYRFAELPANWHGTLRFDVAVPLDRPVGTQLSTGAVLTSDSPESRNNRTPVVRTSMVIGTKEELRPLPDVVLHPRFTSGSADLTRKDRQDLDEVIIRLRQQNVEHITVTGHTDSQRISRRLQARYADNYALSLARARSVGEYLSRGLGLTQDQVTYDGKGPDEAVASNRTEAGRAQNRRVELTICPAKQIVAVPALTSGPPSGMKAVATMGLRPGEEWPRDAAPQPPAEAPRKDMPEYGQTWLTKASAGLDILWPAPGHYPSVPSTKVAVKHDPRGSVTLIVNGKEVDSVYFDGTLARPDGAVGVSQWRGVSLVEGDNSIAVVEYDARGTEVGRVSRTVHYSGPPMRAEVVPALSQLSADGRRPVVVAVRLFDKDGHPARAGMAGDFTVDPPYLTLQRVKDLQLSPVVASTNDRVRYQIGEDGVARLELQPTTQSGEAVLRLAMADGVRDLRVWLAPEDRDWILVGLAEGTVGYNTVRGNMESFGASGGEEHLDENGRVAFYAKGRIKGEWLLTLAYDSARHQNRDPRSMYQIIDPNKYYLLYGDGAEQRYDAASAKSLYVKLERGQFYALFGDYATGLTITELGRYSRNFTGFKSEMKGGLLEYNVFAADTNQAFVKDEIPGDGTSGLYRLSRRNIVLNSERVTIQVRDRFHSENILSSQQQSRFLDYTIDYESGTIFFKQPVFSRDGNFNPIYIVVEYESFDDANTSTTYGGRGAVNVAGNRMQIGATLVHEGRVGGSGDLTGVDASVDLGAGTQLRAEIATTKVEQTGTKADGNAYLAEVTHRSLSLDGRAYMREQDRNFGLGQQNGSETGTRKTGADLSYRLSGPWSLGGEAFRQENLDTGAVRDVAELRGRYAAARYELLGGLRHAEDTFSGTDPQRSEQVYLGGRVQVSERASLRFRHDQSLGEYNAVGDYPTRTTVGADYKLNDTATLFADQEWTYGSSEDATTSRVGLRASPWSGGQVSSTMEQQVTENGVRLFSTTGLKQGWQIDKHWSLDAGLDRSTTYRHPGNTPFNVNVPPASGSADDFTAISLGAGYRQETWSWTGRVERRQSDSEEKLGILMGANGEPRPGVGLSAGLQLFTSEFFRGGERRSGDLRFGLAYRPRETRWIILDRLDYLVNEVRGGGLDYDSRRFVNNFAANYTNGTGLQVALQYGAKYVLESIDGTDYSGYTDLTGIEVRYDLTTRWDIGARGSVLHSWAIGQMDYGTSLSTGFNAGKNMWITIGYNLTGFRDRDFSRADFTSEGPFLKFRLKFDQVSVREAVRWVTGQ